VHDRVVNFIVSCVSVTGATACVWVRVYMCGYMCMVRACVVSVFVCASESVVVCAGVFVSAGVSSE
jgi:hypothetical protein